VRRSIFLAVMLSALLWAAAARTGPIPAADITPMSSAGSGMSDASPAPGDSDQHWRAHHQATATVSGSVRTSALAHAELAAAPSTRAADTARAAGSPGAPARSANPSLRHTPLLI
jgi:hypothetical protein